MKTIRLSLGISIIGILLTLGAFGQSNDEAEIFDLVNQVRSKARLRYLAWNDDLARVARNFSRQMARENFFSHADRNGRTVTERAADEQWSKIGENLFMCDGLDDFTAFSVRGWMKSTSHRRNILDREWTDTGIGVYRTRDDRIYVTQVFVRR